jgi:hypothetical protein
MTAGCSPPMNHAVDRTINDDTEVISGKLARWYGAHAAVRRLWAIEDGHLITVCVSLEPTSDGADALPVWLAMNRKWSSDLQSLCAREVRLEFVEPDVLPPSSLTGNVSIVAEVDWREAWINS